MGSGGPGCDLPWLCPSIWAVQVRALPRGWPRDIGGCSSLCPLSQAPTHSSADSRAVSHTSLGTIKCEAGKRLRAHRVQPAQCQGLHSCLCHIFGVFFPFLAMVKSPPEGTSGTPVWCLQAVSPVLPGSQPGDSPSAGPLSASQAVSRAGGAAGWGRGHSQALTKLHFHSFIRTKTPGYPGIHSG